MQREYQEPFRLLEPDALAERRLLKALAVAGLTCAQRGAFHYAGTVRRFSAAVMALTALYRAACGTIVTVGGSLSPDHSCPVDLRVPVRRDGSRPPRTQVEWLERIVQDLGEIRSTEVR